MNPIDKLIQDRTSQFIDELTVILRNGIVEVAAEALGVPAPKALPMPKRQPKYLREAHTRPANFPSRSLAAKQLTGQLSTAYEFAKRSKRPITSKLLASKVGVSESSARGILSKLLRNNLLTAQGLGDGTPRKVYLLTRR